MVCRVGGWGCVVVVRGCCVVVARRGRRLHERIVLWGEAVGGCVRRVGSCGGYSLTTLVLLLYLYYVQWLTSYLMALKPSSVQVFDNGWQNVAVRVGLLQC